MSRRLMNGQLASGAAEAILELGTIDLVVPVPILLFEVHTT